MRRYVRLFWMQLRMSLATAMHYRLDFLVNGVISLWWMVWTLIPVFIIFGARPTIAEWSLPEALVVIAWFTLLRGLLEGVINPSLQQMVEHIRLGTLDFVLVKPADAQFLASTAKFQPWKIVDILSSFVILGVAFHKLGRVPSAGDVAVAALLLVVAALVLYSIAVLVVCAAFFVVRLDNLSYLFTSVFDAARWPLAVFRGAWKILFTFVIPLGLMTTYPAMAILGRLEARTAVFAVGGACAFVAASRLLWTRALARYTSASS
jgi:ABC-2 type transport system permease protein